MMKHNTRSGRADWQEVNRFVSGDVGISVRRDMSVQWPKFTVKIGGMVRRQSNDETIEEVGSYARIFIVRDSVLPGKMGDSFSRLRAVLDSAEARIAEQIAIIEQERLDAIVERDLAKVKYGQQGHPTIADKRAAALRQRGRRR